MEKIVRFALAALFLLGIASAQNIPAVDVFGGYSYLNFDVPSSGETTSQRLKLNGWDFSASVGLFHHLALLLRQTSAATSLAIAVVFRV